MRFGGVTAVSDLSIALPKGSIAGIIGPNGAGKTTAFNVLSGFYTPQEGDVIFGGKSVKGLGPAQICNLGMKAAIRQRADRPTAYLFSRVNPFLFPGGQAYGYDSLGTEANLGKFTPKDVRGFWEKQLVQPWVLAVAGDFDREAVLAFARSLPTPDGKGFTLATPSWGDARSLDLHLPGRNQAHVLQVFKAVPYTNPDAPALMP